ncbi:MAG: hypothetical protein DRI89_07330, partial [Bacteroidetes bacterium]
MNLMVTINKLAHYPNSYRGKAANIVLTPVNTAIAIITIASTMSIGDVQSQTFNQDREFLGDTIYGTGMFVAQDAGNGENVAGVTLYLRPEAMAMVVPDITYEFI